MIRIWYDPDCDEIWVSGQEQSYARRSLIAGTANGNITVALKDAEAGNFIVNTAWANIGRYEGGPFADQDAALAYLVGEFAKRAIPDALSEPYVAATVLGGHRVVRAVPGGVAYASCDDPDTANTAIGLTAAAASAGESVPVVTHGPITEPSWSFALGPVYLGLDGNLTQTAPGTGCVLRVGRATSSTTLLVTLDEPFFLAA